VGDYFPTGPQLPSGEWVDIVVVTPEGACRCAYSVGPSTDCITVIEDMEYQGDPDGNLWRMKSKCPPSIPPSRVFSSDTERLAFSRTLGGITSPFDCVRGSNTIKETVLDPSGPRYGRPSYRYGPPTALFDRALALLQYDLEHLEALTPSLAIIPHAYNLVFYSTGFFDDEDERELTLRDTLEGLLSGSSNWRRVVEIPGRSPG